MNITRRSLLTGAALSPALTLLPQQKESKRICFFTDAHLPGPDTHPKRLPNEKLQHQARIRKAFDQANAFNPELFIFGGDNVFAVDQENDRANADAQFKNWKDLVKEKVKVPHVSVIGNHDIWYPKDETPNDRKALAIEAFNMPHRYFRHDALGWSFFLLDVYHPGQETEVDDEQFAWLDSELSKTTHPACIVTHGPILSVSTQLVGGAIGGTKELRQLFRKHKNVRLALSGHNHCIDDCEFESVTYICGGAVSGAWWEGSYSHFPPAFIILDLNPDGAITPQTIFWEEPEQQS